MFPLKFIIGGVTIDNTLVLEAYSAAKENLVTFRQLFLPVDDEVKPPWFHYEWGEILLNGNTHYAIEGFRESAKTSIVLRAFPIYCLAFPRKGSEYIVFVMANQTRASQRLKEIANEYVNNDLLNINLVKVNEQSEKVFETIVKDECGEKHTIRFEAYGKGSSVRGLINKDKRPDIVLIDDPQDLADSLSDSIQEHDYEWFLSDIIFLGKKTRIFFIGNNLGAKCLIEQVIDNKEVLKFKTVRIPIINEVGESNWPEQFPVDEIKEEKDAWRSMGKLDIWEREKMCIAVSPESQLFKKDYFKYYAQNELKMEGCSIFVTVDLAISEKETADFTSICAVAVNSENNWFVLDIDFGRYNPSQTLDGIFTMVQKYKPIYVGIEKVAYQAALRHFVEKEMPKRNIWFTIKDLEAKEKKELRISALQPRFKSGTIWFPMGAKFLTELESELLSFPKSLHDDLLDSLAYIEQIALVPVNAYDAVLTDSIPLAGSL